MIKTIEAKTSLPKSFTARPATLEDVTAVNNLSNICDIEILEQGESSEAAILSEWQAEDFDLDNSRVIMTSEGQIVGYAEVYFPTIPERIFIWGRVHPDYRNRGIGTFYLNWGEELARKGSQSLPADKNPVFLAYCHEKETTTKTLFANHDMQLVRRFLNMQIDFDGPPPPPTFPKNIHLITFAEYDNLPAIWRATMKRFEIIMDIQNVQRRLA